MEKRVDFELPMSDGNLSKLSAYIHPSSLELNEIDRNGDYIHCKGKLQCDVVGTIIKNPSPKYDYSKRSKPIRFEKYEEYKKLLLTISPRNTNWIDNIFNGIAEQDKIIFKNDEFIIIPTSTWDIKDIQKMHLLVFYQNSNIKTIRDITRDDVPILKRGVNKAYDIIKEKFNIDTSRIKSYAHYPPSTYRLHFHFNLLDYNCLETSVERAHLTESILQNCELISDYYKLISLATTTELIS